MKDYVRAATLRGREMFVPLAHPAGEAQVDFGEALAVVGGEERQRTGAYSELASHYLFASKFGRPAKGNDKGKVEGTVG